MPVWYSSHGVTSSGYHGKIIWTLAACRSHWRFEVCGLNLNGQTLQLEDKLCRDLLSTTLIELVQVLLRTRRAWIRMKRRIPKRNWSAMEMCQKLQTLSLTLNKQSSKSAEEIQAALLHQVRISNYDPQVITKWATDLVRKNASFKVCEKDDEKGLNITIFGLGPIHFHEGQCEQKESNGGAGPREVS